MTEFSSALVLARLRSLHPRSIDLSLARMRRLLARLDHPERRLPPVVHIAGTNGKGSTLAILDAILTAAGLRVHRYVSPHLVSFNERILIHGRPIADGLLAEVLEACERANDGAPITFFEITTAAALLAFTRVPAEVVLLETGLGGRLDATNVVEAPELVLLAPIGRDHESFLGSRIEDIAREKAGILKPGAPAVFAPQVQPALAVLRERAAALGCPVWEHGRDYRAVREGERLRYRDPAGTLDLPLPALLGRHQLDNAALAVAAARALSRWRIGEAAIARGLRSVRWPGRLQRINKGPLTSRLPEDAQLWIDGAHNPHAAEALARALGELAPGRRWHLVLGMLATKDLEGFLRPLRPLLASLTLVPVPDSEAARDPAQDAERLRGSGLPADIAPDVASALDRLAHTGEVGARVIICGSLYLVGAVLRDHAATPC